uniref:AAA family ATPase n=1 Tax=Euzebya sp. TaxID=1971409 RepID=UPI0035172C76
MRTRTDNPFVPGSDSIPAVWAGRAAELADFRDEVRVRRLAGAYERGRVFIGEPGIGKSVLAGRIARDARELGDLVLPTIRLPRGDDPVPLLAAAVAEAITSRSLGARVGALAADLSERITAISAGVTVRLDASRPATPAHRQLREALLVLATLAAGDGVALVVHVDEVQNITDRDAMSQLLVVLGDVLSATRTATDSAGNPHERHLPVVVVLTGLWNFVDDATRAAGATFARRFKPYHLAALEDADVRTALAPFTSTGWRVLTDDGPAAVTMTAPAVDRLVDAVRGDPFLLQLVGKAAWDAGDGPVIDLDDVCAAVEVARGEMRHHAERALERLP